MLYFLCGLNEGVKMKNKNQSNKGAKLAKSTIKKESTKKQPKVGKAVKKELIEPIEEVVLQ